MLEAAKTAPFGSVLGPLMAKAEFTDGQWGKPTWTPVAPLSIHPAAHVLHYASEIFEGFKAYRWADGSVHVFRMDRHIARFRQSAQALRLPVPSVELLEESILELIRRSIDVVPEAPGSLYLRPALIGTSPNIGAAGSPTKDALLMVLVSPVYDYFAGGLKPLTIYVEEEATRCASNMGMVKTGGNYAAALGPTLHAKEQFAADQVLFAPHGEVQETGASNFVLVREGQLLTKALDRSFLHGVTRDSLLVLAKDMGFEVTERRVGLDETLEWIKSGEAALSGTAAVLAPVGTLIVKQQRCPVGNGQVGPVVTALRNALIGIYRGERADRYGWLTKVN